VSIFGNKAPENIEQLEIALEKAQNEEIGIWQQGIQLGAASSSSSVKTGERVSVLMTDITDASRFYVRFQSDTDYA